MCPSQNKFCQNVVLFFQSFRNSGLGALTIDQCCPQIVSWTAIWEADQGFFFHLLVFIFRIDMIEPNTPILL